MLAVFMGFPFIQLTFHACFVECAPFGCLDLPNSTDTTYAVIRVFDEAGNVIETHEHAGDFKEW